MVAKNAVVRRVGDGAAAGGDVTADSFESAKHRAREFALIGWDFLRRVRVRLSRELVVVVVFQPSTNPPGGTFKYRGGIMCFCCRSYLPELGDVNLMTYGACVSVACLGYFPRTSRSKCSRTRRRERTRRRLYERALGVATRLFRIF